MFVPIWFPPELVDRIPQWADLKRWERREIGQELRQLGLAYREIGQLIPVTKSTLSGWCRDIPLTSDQLARLTELNRNGVVRRSVGTKLRQRALDHAERIRDEARNEASHLMSDSFWTAGVVAYWAEGSKRQNRVVFANSDPALVQLFVAWAKAYFNLTNDRFTAALHLHDGQDEVERQQFWSSLTGIDIAQFRKTFVKPEGTGHRKNVLYNGTIQIRVTKSSELLHRLMGWIDTLAATLANRD